MYFAFNYRRGNRAVHEAMLCGCLIIYYKNVIGGVSDYMNKNNSISYNSEIDLPRKIEIVLKIIKNLILIKETKQLVSEVYQISKFKNVLKEIYKKDNENFDENIDLSELIEN